MYIIHGKQGQWSFIFLSLPGKEKETEDVRDDEHEEDKAPLSTPSEGPGQQWTNRCSNAEIMVRLTMAKISHQSMMMQDCVEM